MGVCTRDERRDQLEMDVDKEHPGLIALFIDRRLDNPRMPEEGMVLGTVSRRTLGMWMTQVAIKGNKSIEVDKNRRSRNSYGWKCKMSCGYSVLVRKDKNDVWSVATANVNHPLGVCQGTAQVPKRTMELYGAHAISSENWGKKGAAKNLSTVIKSSTGISVDGAVRKTHRALQGLMMKSDETFIGGFCKLANYLQQLSEANPGSVIEYQKDKQNRYYWAFFISVYKCKISVGLCVCL